MDGWTSTIKWPDSVHVFASDVETVKMDLGGGDKAAVSGISYRSRNETRNLASLFKPENPDIFQIALLHCNCGAAAEHEPYAPCSMDELSGAGFDYWALGHVHTRGILREKPHLVYPGNIQGRGIHERFERGCYLVAVDEGKVDLEFCPLDSVRWLRAEVSIDGIDSLDELDRALSAAIEDVGRRADGRPAVCRIDLTGRGALYADLARKDAVEGLLERAREEGEGLDPFVWVEKIEFRCAPEIDLDRRREGGDLIGQLLRIADDLRGEEDLAQALAPDLASLHEHRLARKALEDLSRAEIEDLLRQAEYLCVDLLGGDR